MKYGLADMGICTHKLTQQRDIVNKIINAL